VRKNGYGVLMEEYVEGKLQRLIPQKDVFFGWTTFRGETLTMNNLEKRGLWISVVCIRIVEKQ
jgi:hypothetical protein